MTDHAIALDGLVPDRLRPTSARILLDPLELEIVQPETRPSVPMLNLTAVVPCCSLRSASLG